MGQGQHFAHGIINEDEADESTEAFLGEVGKVASVATSTRQKVATQMPTHRQKGR